MKKFRIISSFMVIVSLGVLFGGKKDVVFANELETLSSIVDIMELYEDNLNSSYTTEDGQLTITYSTSGDILTVNVKDHSENIESTVTRNLVTNEVISDGEKVTTYSSVTQDSNVMQANNLMQANDVTLASSGPKIYFNINPNSVANAIALIAAIPAIVTLVATSGLSWAVFVSGLDILLDKLRFSVLIPTKPSVNGYFTFLQEIRQLNGATQYRNTNRQLYVRLNSNSYSVYNYGSGDWFYSTRPY